MKPLVCALVFILGTPICFAQETKESETKKEKHSGFEWLKQFEGNWETSYNGTMSSRTVGERWVVNELSFQGGLASIQTIGYDAKKKQFIGTWIDSTSDYIWQYAGSLDSTGKSLVLEAEGPDLTEPARIRRYRDTYQFTSKNEIAAVSQMLDDKGEWR